MKVYVATVPLRYEIVAVATTEKSAIDAACKKTASACAVTNSTDPPTRTTAPIRPTTRTMRMAGLTSPSSSTASIFGPSWEPPSVARMVHDGHP